MQKKQTAVDYLKKNLASLFENDKSGFYTALFEQAKALEREQIMDAHEFGAINWQGGQSNFEHFNNNNHYYNEIYYNND